MPVGLTEPGRKRREMIRFAARIVYALDRLFPGPRVEGRESLQAYSEWEYRTGKALLGRYGSFFGDLKGMKVLDIGCGLGGKTVGYSEAGGDVTGVDIDRDHCREAVIFSRSKGCGIDFVCGDSSSLPFGSECFDLVVANDSMEHFPDPAKALTELSRVTKKGGSIFLFFTPWGSPLGSHLYDQIKTPWCHLIFPDRLMEELLRIAFEREGLAAPVEEAAKEMDDYRTNNNRIDIASYRKILDSTEGLYIEMEEFVPPKYSFLRPLTKIPGLREFFTGTVVSILRKK